MKIIILIKSVFDTRIPLECIEETGRLMEDWNVPILNPDDGAALAQALSNRSFWSTESSGPVKGLRRPYCLDLLVIRGRIGV